MNNFNNIKLGNKVKDLITGFTGIATSKSENMNGNTQFTITPVAEEGKPYPDSITMDYHTLDVVDEGLAERTTEPTFVSDVDLGNEVECIVTGLKGIATHKLTYMNGCSAYLVTKKELNIQTGQAQYSEDWIDQTRLKVVSVGVVNQVKKNPVAENGARPGGAPMRNVPRG